ncbi:MAG: phosphotransferase [Microbacterium sp.]|uniref:phosphotransferase n=1 Tax=Microbacterium sp. TaxID=51671 RepID=UPI0039E47DD9
MTRSPLTLAAAASAALPRVGVVAAGPFTTNSAGRYDSAVLVLDDERDAVIRVPVDEEAARDLAAEALALRALTPGVRELLGVRAPRVLGDARLRDAHAVVTDLLPGYQVEAAHVPGGPGAAVSIGQALASVHALPATVARSEGLPVRTPEELRADTAALLDRADAIDRVPRTLMARWRGAVASDDVWRFEPTVVLGGAGATSFVFQDTEAGPTVTGILDWHGLSVGDPAVDLGWLASAPDAADDVFDAYHRAAHRSPDALLRSRSRLHAELEFARWLVHGAELRDASIVDDAVALLESLADTVHDDDLVPHALGEPLDDALAILDLEPPAASDVDTSMHTDAYDPEELAQYVADESGQDAAEAPADEGETGPIDLVAWAEERAERDDADPLVAAEEAERASREALRRWAASE